VGGRLTTPWWSCLSGNGGRSAFGARNDSIQVVPEYQVVVT
jgi:hypothetical protein